jgi:signal transduction histidine kinase
LAEDRELQGSIVVHRLRQLFSRSRRFRVDALVSFAIIILLLTVGMGFALRRIEHVTARQLTHVQAEEHEITLVERLRWSGELLVSAGRGYLISGDPTQLANLSLAQTDFDTAVHALERTDLSPKGASLVGEVRQAATEFRRVQELLLKERRPDDLAEIVERFETELLPARIALRRALERLVGHKTAVIESVYAEATQQRGRLMGWMYGLLATLAFGSLGVAWFSASKLARTYRREADALETARNALRARDELMGIVAHDLRSPLGAITMRAELLEQTTADAHARDQAAAINNTATRMAHLIKTLLDVNVIEAGQLTVDKSPCHVDRLVREVFDMFSTIAASKQLHFEQRVSEADMVVLADCERIFQVLSNLLGNAIKFTPTKGHVTLSAERSGDVVTFAISDTGPGISEDHLPHVFDRYWKDEKRGTKGTGLGLFIAKSIIDAHGGRLTVESSPNHGAKFRFTLPCPPESTSTPPSSA